MVNRDMFDLDTVKSFHTSQINDGTVEPITTYVIITTMAIFATGFLATALWQCHGHGKQQV